MSEQRMALRPVVIFLPPTLEKSQVPLWRDSLLAELDQMGMVRPEERPLWELMLDETGSMDLPETVSGRMLLLTEGAAPVYLWATLSQPAGKLMELGEAILDIQVPEADRADPMETAQGSVLQGSRFGRTAPQFGVEVVSQVVVTVATIDLTSVGEVDVCLWFGSDELEAVDSIASYVAELMLDPDLHTYLSA